MSKFFALIPAAGFGARMKTNLPKQYLSLGGRPMIYYAVRTLYLSPDITNVVVILSPEDREWLKYDWSEFSSKLIVLNCGGETRAMSTLNGLMAISESSLIHDEDWVLVHDAARPCLSEELLKRMLDELSKDTVGGLLAVPISDTLKRSGINDRVQETESRKNLWQAQTPQMFRLKLLMNALCKPNSVTMTDDASAVEALGLYPKLVLGDVRNIKITYPKDLSLAELILREQQGEV
ncbi:MAG: 2-C-methyl-D-erythritol 4-phosphate cytidylyltransferase [Nitrosomonadaceae bacterium]|nr:2-C-methyl-D-erythritol 4-phosphate cytidylyltransferase [Nitrosomonadaceae bacterium]|tara:strand:- start:938 stop:1645 length:708 start_codon:yes stop_codon:yes gene_type:complete